MLNCPRGISGLAEGFSFVEGPTEPPLLETTIPEHLARIVAQYGDKPAVIARSPTLSSSSPTHTHLISTSPHQTTTLSYTSLLTLSTRLAHALTSPPFSLQPGDRLAVSLGNGVEHAALAVACFQSGIVLVPLNPAFTPHQVAGALRHLGVRVLVVGAATDVAYRPGRGWGTERLVRGLLGVESGGGTGKGEAEGDEVKAPTLERVVVVDNSAFHADVTGLRDWFCDLPDGERPRLRQSVVSYASLLESAPSPVSSSLLFTPARRLDPTDTINIQFTSGTTSTPKAARLTHRSILNNGHLIARRMGLRPGEDRIVVPPPLFHCFGSVLGFLATASTGCAILFPSPAFDPVATLRMVSNYEANGVYGVSTMFVSYLEALKADPGLRLRQGSDGMTTDGFANLRTGIVAGSTVPESLMARVRSELGPGILEQLVICYGQTETSPVSCMTLPSDPPDRRLGTVGVAMPHTAVKIVDALDRARILPVGEKGELAAAGYLVMKGYFGDEGREQKDGMHDRRVEWDEDSGREMVWMYSGDEASMDADGYVRITGRIKDLIIRGGENIHPLEIEDCLFRHPAVREASVVGVPDERLGEAVAAFVVVQEGVQTATTSGPTTTGRAVADDAETREVSLSADDVRDWVRRHLSRHLVPKHVFFVAEYPKTASGKIQKFKLREMAREMLAAGDVSRGKPDSGR